MEIEIEMFQLTKPLQAVQFAIDGKGFLCTLPANARVRVLGLSEVPGCLMVAYDDTHFNIFKEDLRRHANPRRAAMAAYAGVG